MADSQKRTINIFVNDKDAGRTLKDLNAEAKKLRSEINSNLTPGTKEYYKAVNRLKELNGTFANHRKQIKGTSDAWDKAGKSSSKLSGALGSLGLAGGLGLAAAGFTLLAQGVREAFQTYRDFTSAQSELAAILGRNKKDIGELKSVILDLGASTAFSATEVTRASTELAKLGVEYSKIGEILPSVLDGAIAFGVEIDQAAALSTKTLNAFGLEASEAERVVSTLAVAGTKSAIDFEFLNDSMTFAAVGAKNMGQSIETTTAQIGVLADNGIKASTAGTSLRSIFTELSKSGQSLEGALNKINSSQNKSKTAFELFGATAKDAAVILAENQDRVVELTGAITNQGDALKKLTEERLDNVDGKLKILSSSWEGFILSIESGDGVITSILKGLLDFAIGAINVFTDANKIIGVFLSKLRVEFQPLVELFSQVTSGLAKFLNLNDDFASKGNVTKLLVNQVVLAFKRLFLGVRIAAQSFLLLKDGMSVAINEGKKLLNLLGGDFKVDPSIDVDDIKQRLTKIKDVFTDTFTVNESVNPDIKTGDTPVVPQSTANISNQNSSQNNQPSAETSEESNALKQQQKEQEAILKEKQKFQAEIEALERESALKLLGEEEAKKAKIDDDFAAKLEKARELYGLESEQEAALLVQREIRKDEITEEFRLLREEQEEERKEVEEEKLLEEAEALIEKYALDEEQYQEHKQRLLDIAEAEGVDKAAIEEKFAEEELIRQEALNTAKVKAEEELQAARLGALKAGVGALKTLAGENEDLQKGLFFIEKAIAAGEVVVNLQREIASIAAANAILGPAGAAITATQTLAAKIRAATGLATIAATTITQKKEGGFVNVRGNDDGKMYNAEYIGNMPSGLVPGGPKLALINEAGPEFVISNRALKHPGVLRAARAIDNIQRSSHRQFVDGGFTQDVEEDSVPVAPNVNIDVNNERLVAVLEELATSLPRIRAVIDDQTIADLDSRRQEIAQITDGDV